MQDFPLTVTAWTAAILGAWMLYLTLRVVGKRRGAKIVLGDGDDRDMTKRIRGHANAAEQIPIALILLGLAELLNPPAVAIVIAVVLICGRLSHGYYFAHKGVPHQFRSSGMVLTLFAQGIAIAAVLIGLLFN